MHHIVDRKRTNKIEVTFKMRVCCSYAVAIGLIIFSAEATFQGGDSASEELSSLIKSLEPADNLSAATTNGLFLLVPSNINLTDIFNEDSDFSLFKLNTDLLLGGGGNVRSRRSTTSVISPSGKQAIDSGRMSRKINLFRNLFNKPKYSPLYLVNGTVCRFVNSAPVCTTISTNGLPGLNQQFGNQQFNQQPQQQTPFQNQGQLTNNPQQQQFSNNNNNQQLRPAGLMDDGTPDINVSNINNITSGIGSRVFKSNLKPQSYVPTVTLGPSDHGSKYRPLNLHSLGRPVRQLINGQSNLSSSNRLNYLQNLRGGRKGD